MVVFGQKGLYSGKVVVFEKNVWFVQNSCTRVKAVVFGQSCCIPSKVVVFGQSGCTRAKWFGSDKNVVFW